MKDPLKKLEAATEGSRELDSFLANSLGWHSANPCFEQVRYWRQFDPENYTYESISWSPPDDWGGGPWGAKLPHYTTSIDAALTLVPDGWTITLHHGYRISASLRDQNTGRAVKIYASSLVLALCIAALKARES